jgi:hypothetical protein
MNLNEFHYTFKLKADKVNSLQNENFEVWDIDFLLNFAQIYFLKQRAGTNNLYQSGFEKIQKRVDDLSTLVIKFPLQPVIVPASLGNGIYEVELSDLAYSYYQLERIEADIFKTGCGTRRVRKPEFARENNIGDILVNPFQKPSFEWYSLPYQFGKSSSGTGTSIYFYTNGDFTVTGTYPEYLKMPNNIHFGGYTSLSGQVTPVNCEFPDSTHDEIVNIAVNEAARIIKDDPAFFQTTQDRLTIQE